MMKLSLALLAVGAMAARIEPESCYGEWIYQVCSDSYRQEDYCRGDCGWWYTITPDDASWDDDYWVSCDEYDQWTSCNPVVDCNAWHWDDCVGEWWREICADDSYNDYGWIYVNNTTGETYFVTYDEWLSLCDKLI